MIEVNNYAALTAPRRTIIDEAGNTFQIQHYGALTTVSVTLPNGIRARGNALHNPVDVYNKQFGEALATARASSRALNKYARWLSREGFRLGDIR